MMVAAACDQCQARAARPLCGAFHFGCVQCCAALVRSAHPDRRQASVMLAAISRFEGAPARQAILNGVAEGLAAAGLGSCEAF